MTVKLIRDALGTDVPQTVDDNGNIAVHATGDTTGINFGKTKLLRDVLGSPIPNQIYDVDARKWVIDEGGSSPIGDTIAWSNITNKPTSYPPQSHTHEIANVNGLQVALNNKADGEDLTELERKTNEHLAQSSGKHIHSSGSNENGYWIKFDDGTQICYQKSEITMTIDIQEGSIFKSEVFNWIFPANFLVAPSTNVNAGLFGNKWASNNDTSNILTQYRVMSASSLPGASNKIELFAIGRWK